MSRAWAIKLGSGGRCVPFCEERKIVGVGWGQVDGEVLRTATRSELAKHVGQVCDFYKTKREVGAGTGQLHRFARECQIGDFALYYVPKKKQVVVCRIAGDLETRARSDGPQDVDIWHYRRVEYPIPPIPLLDLYGPLKGQLLGPRMSFWEVRPAEVVSQLAAGQIPSLVAAADPELRKALEDLRGLVLKRLEALQDRDWENFVVDYFREQGAVVDERGVGGSTPVIDLEARFDHGDLGSEVWRVQVKRYKGEIGWDQIAEGRAAAGDARFCFVSANGFTEEAREKAEDDETATRLMEAEDFVWFALTGRIREELRARLRLPVLGRASGARRELEC